MKILNLYAGIGGNRKLWGDEHEVTAIENNPEIAKIYQKFFPNDKVIVCDAHKYLLEHFKEFDFIWSSPPCPTHSRMRFALKKARYIDLTLWQEIILLKHNFKGKWIVENVIPYYTPFIRGTIIGRHMIWSNFNINSFNIKCSTIALATKEDLARYHGMPICRRAYLRNCVYPKLGLHIFRCAFKEKHEVLTCSKV